MTSNVAIDISDFAQSQGLITSGQWTLDMTDAEIKRVMDAVGPNNATQQSKEDALD